MKFAKSNCFHEKFDKFGYLFKCKNDAEKREVVQIELITYVTRGTIGGIS